MATLSAAAPAARAGGRGSVGTALFRRAFLDARVRTVAFAYVFGVYSWLQAAGYRATYPTLPDRVDFAEAFAGNAAIRLFYGYPFDVTTIGGYCAWRVGGTLVLAAAAFGLLAAIRALRTEEESGRTELVLAGAVPRGTAFGSAMAAILAGTAVLWLAEFVGFVVGRLPARGSAYLALATVMVIPVFAGVGALASQVFPTRRQALTASTAVAAAAWLLRTVADTLGGGGWIRWTTPLGWAEELRPFTAPRPWVLVLFVAASVPMFVVAARISAGRDVGAGLVAARDEAGPRLVLLSSVTAQVVRSERTSLITWLLGVGAFSAVLGMISTSISAAGISQNIQKDIEKFGVGSIATPSGYLAFIFLIVVLAISLFVCAQIASASSEEAAGRLETLLAQPVARVRWLGGRLVVAAVAVGVLSMVVGLVTWAGASSQGVHVSLPHLLEAGANCIPMALLFLGLGALAYAALPRACTAISYGLVFASFIWYLVGSVLGLPEWVVDLTPFRHFGLVPAQPFQAVSAAVMVAIGVVAAVAALAVFRRRDLLSP